MATPQYTPLLNHPQHCVDELLDGLTKVHTGIAKLKDTRVVVDRSRVPAGGRSARVELVTGGGSGHEPFAAGYVGSGLLTSAVAGSVFASPPVSAIVSAIVAAARVGGGDSSSPPGEVLVIVFNYTGDRLNFGQAVEKCRARGYKVEMFVSGDDSALTSLEGTAGRRGLCGTMFLLKIVGALAERGASMQELLDTCRQVAARCSTLGVAASGCTVPGQQQPLFTVQPGRLELGLGVHGEAGVRLLQASSAAELVQTMLSHLLQEDSETNVPLAGGDQLVVILNNLGAMTQMEMLVLARETHRALVAKQLQVRRLYVGCLMTSLDMRGFHISLLKVTGQPEWLGLLDAPTGAPAWPQPYRMGDEDPNFEEKLCELQEEVSPLKPQVQYSVSSEEAATVQQVLARLVLEVRLWTEQLNQLDTGCGDGDCGSTLTEGANKLGSCLESLPYTQPLELLRQLADIASEYMGGTSGALYSILLSAMANSLSTLCEAPAAATTSRVGGNLEAQEVEDRHRTSGGGQVSPTMGDWLRALTDGVDAVAKYGGARRGHRTILDALYPALDAAHALGGGATGWAPLLEAMSQGANQGAAATSSMTAKAGRASYVRGGQAEKEDAGAKGVALILASLSSSLQQLAAQQ